ncbi:short-chain dehydrogenase [Penicillium herquei]|nr:short-chain dehydrogenase [Penicillium herquei]
MQSLKRIWPQLLPSKPTFGLSSIPPQKDRVVIITGSTSGIGLELARLYYDAGATVYMAVRNETKAKDTIKAIMEESTSAAPGKFHVLRIDLSDLSTIKPFVTEFLSQESRLDLLHNNAGVANMAPSQRTAQGIEPHLGINCAAPYLLTSLLSDILIRTAANPETPPNTVRVIWSSSMLVDAMSPSGGIPPSHLEAPGKDVNRNYALSKTGNWFLADRMAKHFNTAAVGERGVISITANPGNIQTPMWDTAPKIAVILSKPVFYTVKKAAITLLWAGCSQEVTVKDGGRYVIPFGKWHPNPRPDLLREMEDKEGVKGNAKILEEWCDKVTQAFR